MLSNEQYAAAYGVSATIEEGPNKRAIEDCLAFTIELSDGSDLWYGKRVASEVAPFDKSEEIDERAANLAGYIARGYAFESPIGEVDDDDE